MMARKKKQDDVVVDPVENLKLFTASISKDWEKQVLGGEEIQEEKRLSISSGSTKLDWALTKPFVEGTINELYGDNGCGKTTMSLEIATSAMKMGKPVFFFDLERKLVNSQLEMIQGLRRDMFWRIRPDNGEDAVNKVHRCVSEVPGCVVIFDSLTQLLPEVEDAEGAEKQQMGAVARLAAKMVRKIAGPVERNHCMVLFISHITTNMNPYAGGDTTKGGKAVPDICAQRVRLKRLNSELITDKDGNFIGQNTKCKVIKNNQGVPFKEVTVPIIYGKGIDRTLDLLQTAKDLAIIDYKKQGGWYTYEFGGETRSLHEQELLDILKENKIYREQILAQVLELL